MQRKQYNDIEDYRQYKSHNYDFSPQSAQSAQRGKTELGIFHMRQSNAQAIWKNA